MPTDKPLSDNMQYPTMLYEVEFEDGTGYAQNSRDKSQTDPLKSCYADWEKRKNEVVRFVLAGQDHVWTVDLDSGEFTIDGLPFTASREWLKAERAKKHLIWFVHTRPRQVRNSDADILSESYRRRYVFGWETILGDGTPLEAVIGVDEE